MAVLVTRNFSEAEGPVVPPLKSDGSMWPWCMYFNGNWEVAYADTLSELVAVLIPDYESLSEDDQDVARMKYAIQSATITQAEIIGTLQESDPVLSEAETEIALHPKFKPHPGPVTWDSPIPLITIRTNYAPFTEAEPPQTGEEGLVIEVDATEEQSFLFGLAHIGAISVMSSR